MRLLASPVVLGAGLLVVLNIVLWASVMVRPNVTDQVLLVAFLNVGQGDATFIQTPNGTQVLLDGGGSGPVVLRALREVMPFWDRSLDLIIATHPDQDHIGGLPEVLNRFSVTTVLETGVESDNQVDDQFRLLSGIEGAAVVLARRGQRWWLDRAAGVYLDILFPDDSIVSRKDINDTSVVARLVYGETEFLFTGDASQAVEEYLVWLNSTTVKADVLKVGHHGSRTSTSDLFLSWVDPEYAIISAGRDNRYGHPHSEVLQTLENFVTTIVSTEQFGTIEFVSDGRQLKMK